MTSRNINSLFQAISCFKTMILCIIYLVLWTSMFSQEDNLVLKAKDLVYSNPDEAIKIADHILKTSLIPQEKAIANNFISESYFVKGNYNEAIVFAFDNTNQLASVNDDVRIENYILKAKLLRVLFLDKQSQNYLKKAEDLYSKTENRRDKLLHNIALERINMRIDRLNSAEALTAINHLEDQLHSFYQKNSDEQRGLFLAKERAFIDLVKLDSAHVYMAKTLALIDTFQIKNLYEKAVIYKELGRLHLKEKAFINTEESLFLAMRFAEMINNPSLLMLINRDLALNYLASNQKNKYRVYNEEFLLLNSEVEQLEANTVNTFYNLISKEQNKQDISHQKIYDTYLNFFIIGALLLIAIGLFILIRGLTRIKRLREIIKYLEISRDKFNALKPSKKTSSKRLIIPEETEKNILLKLKQFETSNKFLSKDMSLAVLAVQFDTNTKYLSEIINKNYNDNFHTFINKLRINYIINKLKKDSNYMNYKIRFLAEECGYSSHSSFATVFKSIIGMSPVTFIKLINEDRKSKSKKSA